jgi:TM2 domain-containing membrane protein YozV
MSQSYYIRIRGQVQGPFTHPQIVAMMRRNRLGRHHEISADGAIWSRVADMPELTGQWAADAQRIDRLSPVQIHPETALTVEPAAAEWFYASGTSQLGPVTLDAIRTLLANYSIEGTTLVWKKGQADWIPAKLIPELSDLCGGQPSARLIPALHTAEVSVNPTGAASFCTSCGKSVSAKAVACPHCGVPPRAERSFCHSCGTGLRQNQIMCVACGSDLREKAAESLAANGQSVIQGRSRTTAALLALFVGTLGVHKFYHGSWGWGLVYLFTCITLIPAIISFVEAIVLLTMDDSQYHGKYNLQPDRAFRW